MTEKVKISKEFAEDLEFFKKEYKHDDVYDFLYCIYENDGQVCDDAGGERDEVYLPNAGEYIYDEIDAEIACRAWLDGYEVEKRD